MFGLKSNNMNNFHPLEVVDRGSETQLQVGEKYIIQFSALRVNGQSAAVITLLTTNHRLSSGFG